MLAGITAQFMSPLWFFQVQDLGCLLAVSKCMSLDSAERQNQCRERETKTERNINTQRKRFIILLHITDNIIYYRASLVAQLIRNPSAMQETLVQFLGQEDPLEDTQEDTHSSILGLPCGSLDSSLVKNPPANAGDVGSIPGSGRSPGVENGNPLQYSCLENPMG